MLHCITLIAAMSDLDTGRCGLDWSKQPDRGWAHIALLHLVLLTAHCLGSEIRGPYQSPQRTNQTTTSHFYVHNALGVPFDVRVRCLAMEVKSSDWAAFPRLMVRVLDRDERRIFRGQITCARFAQREGIAQEALISVPRSEPGVAQVVVSAGRSPETTFDVSTEPALPMGLMGSVKVIVPPRDGIESGFVYVPPGARSLSLEPFDTEVAVWDERGAKVLNSGKGTIPVRKTDVVWRVCIKPRRWPGAKILTNGFPVIVCPDEQTARVIRGSVERLDDGTIVAHKFQVRLDRLLRKTFPSPQSFALDPIRSFEPMTGALLSDPDRYRHLVVGYTPPLPYLKLWLGRQVLDSSSPYFGGIHAPSRYGAIMTPYSIPGSPLNPGRPVEALPAATDEAAHDEWTSFSAWGFPAGMGFVHNLEAKINPYHRSRNLLNRVIAAACRDLMLLDEAELVQKGASDWMGSSAFIFRYQFTDAYGHVGQAAKEAYPEIHREWTDGLCRFADRLAYMSVFAPANQAAHIPYGLWRVYQGSGDGFYRELTRYTAQRLCDVLQKPAGYLVEGYGPCTSYNGITLDLFAMLYVDTQMPLFRDSLQKAFYCFNHTVAPEPSGQLIGVTDLNHRVQMPWTYTQHGGGKRMIAPYLKEAGVWFRNRPTEPEQAKLAESIRERAKTIPYPPERCAEILRRNARLTNGSSRRNYEYYNAGVMGGGVFPYEEEPFFRNLGDEFICVKQPRYYCLVYVGKPGIPQRTRPVPPDKTGARTGGGVSLLWTPEYGVAMAGQGWNAYCHHGLIVDMGRDVVRTADYFAIEFDLDTAGKVLSVRGKIKDVPLRYRYGYRFAEDRVTVETQVAATEDVSALGCDIQFPLFASKERGFLCDLPQGPTQCIRVNDGSGAGIELRFDRPVQATFGPTSKRNVYPVEYAIRQLRIALPKKWREGDEFALRYDVVPAAPQQ